MPTGCAIYLETDKHIYVIEVTEHGCSLVYPRYLALSALQQPQPVAVFVRRLLQVGLDLFPALQPEYKPYTDKVRSLLSSVLVLFLWLEFFVAKISCCLFLPCTHCLLQDAGRENELYRQLAMAAAGVALRPSVWNRGFVKTAFALRVTSAIGGTLEELLPPTEQPASPTEIESATQGSSSDAAGANNNGPATASSLLRPKSTTDDNVPPLEKRKSQSALNENGSGAEQPAPVEIKPPDRTLLDKLINLLALHYKDPFRLILWEDNYVYPLLQREGSETADSSIVAMDLSISATVFHMLHAAADELGRKLIDDAPAR